MKPAVFKMYAISMILALILSTSSFAQCGGGKAMSDEGVSSADTPTYGEETVDTEELGIEEIEMPEYPEDGDDIMAPPAE
ncbi:MAG: hypothetical protein RBU23_02595 [Candidatus Auribacterota bacterium]|jgi:hypothetical protein|nr:hypothetical protein [Candidatus Auribacterota bacterium]